MSDVKTKLTALTDQQEGKEILFFIQAEYLRIKAEWTWESGSNRLFCSDVMTDSPDPTYTKCLVHPDDMQALVQHLADVRASKEQPFAFRVITSYGQVFTITGTEPFCWEEVLPEILLPADREATDWAEKNWLKEQLDAAAGQLKAYRQGEAIAGTGHWSYNSSTGEVWYSDNVFRLFGLPSQSLNAHLHTFHAFLHPDDRDIVSETKAEAIARQLPFQLEFRIVRSDLSEGYLHEFCSWEFNEKGQLVLNGSLLRTDEIRLQEDRATAFKTQVNLERKKLRLAEEAGSLGVFEVNLFTREAWFSDGLYRLLGLKPGAKPAGLQLIFENIHHADREAVQKAITADFSAHEVTELTFRLARPDGKLRLVRRKGRVLTNEKEQPVAIGVYQDITREAAYQKESGKVKADIQLLRLDQQLQESANQSASWHWNLTEDSFRPSQNLWRLLGTRPSATEFSWPVFLRFVVDDDRARFESCVAAAKVADEDQSCTFSVLRNNELRHLTATFHRHTTESQTWLIASLRDVTETHHLQNVLDTKDRFTQLLINNTGNIVLISDASHHILFWNQAFETTFGVKQEKVSGKSLFDIVPSLKNNIIVGEFNKALAGETVRLENYHLPGTKEIVNMNLAPMRDDRGNVTGVLHVLQNTSREHMLREQLTQRLIFIENLLEVSVDRIIVLDRNMNYQYWNRQAEEYYGVRKEEVIGRNILELFPSFATDPSYTEFRKVLRGETIHIPAQENLTEKRLYYETYLIPLKADGKDVSGILWIVHNLSNEYHLQEVQRTTQRQLAAEHRRLNEAQAIGKVGSFEWEAATNETYWSDELYRIHGLEPQAEKMTVERALSFVHPDDAADALKEFMRCRSEECSVSLIHRIIRADGEERIVARQFVSFVGEDGTVTHLSGTVRDLTDQQKSSESS